MKKLSKNENEEGEVNRSNLIGKEGWLRAMAKIHRQRKDFEHKHQDSTIFLNVTRYGNITYKNKNKVSCRMHHFNAY